MTTNLLILKAYYIYKQACELDGGKCYWEKTEFIESEKDSARRGIMTDSDFVEWIDSLKADIAKTPEQRAEEAQAWVEELAERDAMEAYYEIQSMRHERDEWDDFWDDRARSVGARYF